VAGGAEAGLRQEVAIDADLALASLPGVVLAAQAGAEVLEEELNLIAALQADRQTVRVVGGDLIEPRVPDLRDGGPGERPFALEAPAQDVFIVRRHGSPRSTSRPSSRPAPRDSPSVPRSRRHSPWSPDSCL